MESLEPILPRLRAAAAEQHPYSPHHGLSPRATVRTSPCTLATRNPIMSPQLGPELGQVALGFLHKWLINRTQGSVQTLKEPCRSVPQEVCKEDTRAHSLPETKTPQDSGSLHFLGLGDFSLVSFFPPLSVIDHLLIAYNPKK